MSSILYRIFSPIILAGIFAISIFIAIDYNKIDPSFYVTLAFLTLFTFSFGYAVAKSVSSPIQELLNRVKELRDGNLSARIYFNSKDELSELAEALNQIAAELEASQQEKKQAQALIDISVKARTKDLENIIRNLEYKVKNKSLELYTLVNESKKLQLQIQMKERETGRLNSEIDTLKEKVG